MSATLRASRQWRPSSFGSQHPKPFRAVSPIQHRGAAIAEAIIALPILLAVILGAIQFGLIYQAKATLNHAALQAARSGAVTNANAQAIRNGLAKGLLPLYSPASSLSGIATTLARIHGEIASTARIRILNPTRDAFADFGEDIEGVREIPNDRLHTRSTAVGAQSGLNIQDANILRVEITYGYELKVPLVNWFITRTLLATRGNNRPADPFEQQLLRRTFLPIVATSNVRMQSPARLNELFVSRADLPNAHRMDPVSAPPDIDDEEQHEGSDSDDSSSGEDDTDNSLADGFFGFGSGSADGTGGGASSGSEDGGTDSGAGGGGENSGNPQMCSIGAADHGLPPGGPPPLAAIDASQPSMLPSLSVGNPIHVATGNKYQMETDLPALPGPDGLVFARHYNSDAATQRGVFGAGWRHSYQATLVFDEPSDSLSIVQADGRRVNFTRNKDREHDERKLYLGPRASDGHVEAYPREMVWRPNAQRALHFDAQGRLLALKSGSRETRLDYDRYGRLDRVHDAQGRTLRLVYYRNGRVARVITPAGTWRYRYDAVGNLTAVYSQPTTRCAVTNTVTRDIRTI